MAVQKVLKRKGIRGEARTEHGEVKERCNLSLTPTAITALDRIAQKLLISRSEVVERAARGDGEILALLAVPSSSPMIE
jgi:hypothetical protein